MVEPLERMLVADIEHSRKSDRFAQRRRVLTLIYSLVPTYCFMFLV